MELGKGVMVKREERGLNTYTGMVKGIHKDTERKRRLIVERREIDMR